MEFVHVVDFLAGCLWIRSLAEQLGKFVFGHFAVGFRFGWHEPRIVDGLRGSAVGEQFRQLFLASRPPCLDGQQFALRGFEDSTALRDFPAFALQRLLEPVRLSEVLRADDARRGVHAQEDSAERTEERVRVVRLHVVHGQTLGAEDDADACGTPLHDDFGEDGRDVADRDKPLKGAAAAAHASKLYAAGVDVPHMSAIDAAMNIGRLSAEKGL